MDVERSCSYMLSAWISISLITFSLNGLPHWGDSLPSPPAAVAACHVLFWGGGLFWVVALHPFLSVVAAHPLSLGWLPSAREHSLQFTVTFPPFIHPLIHRCAIFNFSCFFGERSSCVRVKNERHGLNVNHDSARRTARRTIWKFQFFTFSILQLAFYKLQFAIYSLQFTVYSSQFTLYLSHHGTVLTALHQR